MILTKQDERFIPQMAKLANSEEDLDDIIRMELITN